MSHAQMITRQNLKSLKNQLTYSNDCLSNRIDEMEDWEVKEFLEVNAEYRAEIASLEKHIKENF